MPRAGGSVGSGARRYAPFLLLAALQLALVTLAPASKNETVETAGSTAATSTQADFSTGAVAGSNGGSNELAVAGGPGVATTLPAAGGGRTTGSTVRGAQTGTATQAAAAGGAATG